LSSQTARHSYTKSDRVNSTLQKAVKDGNVLEKIRAFELQAAAAQAESTSKQINNGIQQRTQPTTPTIQSSNHRLLNSNDKHSTQHSISPMLGQQEQRQHTQLSNTRSHRGRHIHPAPCHREGSTTAGANHGSRNGVHVLEPVHGDIILKRRTPSQRTVNDENCSTTMMSSVPISISHGNRRQHSRHREEQQQHHRRTNTSHSRHRQEPTNDRRKPTEKDKSHHKSESKAKNSIVNDPSTTTGKTSSRYRWLKGRKETSTNTKVADAKQDELATTSKKTNKQTKKSIDETVKKSTKTSSRTMISNEIDLPLNNNHVCSASTIETDGNVNYKIVSSHLPVKTIPEISNQQQHEDESTVRKIIDRTSDNDKLHADRFDETAIKTNVERRTNKIKQNHPKLSSTDGDILDKVDDDNRFVNDHVRWFVVFFMCSFVSVVDFLGQ
jgi:hypothetical protein